MWNLVYYRTVNGRCPVREYLDKLDAKEAERVVTKKTGKTPPAEIKAAERRMNEYLDKE